MKRTSFFALLLLAGSCQRTEPIQPAASDLAGNWQGTYDIQQAGSCNWSGPTSLPTTATWQVSGTQVTGSITRQYGQTSTLTQLTGTISGSTVQVIETKANNVSCDGVARTYISRYEGTINGNALTLNGTDTLCPVQGCIFRRTLKLTRS